RSEDSAEEICIGSIDELKSYISEALNSGVLSAEEQSKMHGIFEQYSTNTFDLHRPYVDYIILVKNGKKLFREPDLIDVWFDSGAMPYAQWGLDLAKMKSGEKQPFA